MKLGDLTTLAHVKDWIGSEKFPSTPPVPGAPLSSADRTLTRLITSVSSEICAYLERPYLLPKTYTLEQYDGKNSPHQFLRNWPVNSVQAPIYIDGQAITYLPSTPGQPTNGYGFRFETWDGIPPGGPQAVTLVGGVFCNGTQNILITYSAGYLVSSESFVVPTTNPPKYITLQPQGMWATDQGIMNVTTGVAMTLAAAGTNPGPGQYQISDPEVSPGEYTFNAAQEGHTLLISYGFIPDALEQIAIELTAERYLYRSHIGETSRMMGGEVTVKYDTSETPKYAIPTLQRYRSILPV